MNVFSSEHSEITTFMHYTIINTLGNVFYLDNYDPHLKLKKGFPKEYNFKIENRVNPLRIQEFMELLKFPLPYDYNIDTLRREIERN